MLNTTNEYYYILLFEWIQKLWTAFSEKHFLTFDIYLTFTTNLSESKETPFASFENLLRSLCSWPYLNKTCSTTAQTISGHIFAVRLLGGRARHLGRQPIKKLESVPAGSRNTARVPRKLHLVSAEHQNSNEDINKQSMRAKSNCFR